MLSVGNGFMTCDISVPCLVFLRSFHYLVRVGHFSCISSDDGVCCIAFFPFADAFDDLVDDLVDVTCYCYF